MNRKGGKKSIRSNGSRTLRKISSRRRPKIKKGSEGKSLINKRNALTIAAAAALAAAAYFLNKNKSKK